jgi:hypothetical protein
MGYPALLLPLVQPVTPLPDPCGQVGWRARMCAQGLACGMVLVVVHRTAGCVNNQHSPTFRAMREDSIHRRRPVPPRGVWHPGTSAGPTCRRQSWRSGPGPRTPGGSPPDRHLQARTWPPGSARCTASPSCAAARTTSRTQRHRQKLPQQEGTSGSSPVRDSLHSPLHTHSNLPQGPPSKTTQMTATDLKQHLYTQTTLAAIKTYSPFSGNTVILWPRLRITRVNRPVSRIV